MLKFTRIGFAFGILGLLLTGCNAKSISAFSLPPAEVTFDKMPDVPISSRVNVHFDASLVGGKTVAAVVYEFSSDGRSFSSPVFVKTSQPSFLWDTPANEIPQRNAVLRITVFDSRGIKSPAKSSNPFAILRGPSLTINESRKASDHLSETFSGSCTPGIPITFTPGISLSTQSTQIQNHYAPIVGPSCVPGIGGLGSWSLTINESQLSAIFKYNLKQTDLAGSVSQVDFTWVRTRLGPVIDSGSLVLSESESGTVSSQDFRKTKAFLSVKASDSIANITQICLKKVFYTSGARVPPADPASNDFCWKSLLSTPYSMATPGQSVSLLAVPYFMGHVPGEYDFYIWFKNEVGYSSSLVLVNGVRGGVGTDTAHLNFNPPKPPMINNIVASNIDNPSFPIKSSEMSVNTSLDPHLFIRWNAVDVATNQNPGVVNVKLSYTTDEVNDIPIDSITNTGSGCTPAYLSSPGTAETGCYLWSVPLSLVSGLNHYLKVRVVITNSSGLVASATSAALNTGDFHWLAGNTDLGTLGNAQSAVFSVNGAGYHSFVVARDGAIYLKDMVQGVLRIDPESSRVSVFLKKGTFINDSTPRARNAFNVAQVAMDYQDQLLVWDYSGKILRIDPTKSDSEPSITTLDSGLPTATQGHYGALFQPLPDGSLAYQLFTGNQPVVNPDSNPVVRIYHPGGQGNPATYENIRLSGLGVFPGSFNGVTVGAGVMGDSARDLYQTADPKKQFRNFSLTFDSSFSIKGISAEVSEWCTGGLCKPDMVTYNRSGVNISQTTDAVSFPNNHIAWTGSGAFNARDGSLYSVSSIDSDAGRSILQKFNPVTKNWITVLGKDANRGRCAEGQIATNCGIRLRDAFVTEDNQIYFIDGTQIRTVDGSGKIRDVFGQDLTFGDGSDKLATAARFNRVDQVALLSGPNLKGSVVVHDLNELRIRIFKPGENVSFLKDLPSAGQVVTVPRTDEMIVGYSNSVPLDRYGLTMNADRTFTLPASSLMGGPRSSNTVWYMAGDGRLISDINLAPTILGVSDQANPSLLTYSNYYDYNDGQAHYGDPLLKQFDLSGPSALIQKGFSGKALGGVSPVKPNYPWQPDFCTLGGASFIDGTQVSACDLPVGMSRPSWNSDTQSWMMSKNNHNAITSMPVSSGAVVSRYTLPRGVSAYQYVTKVASGTSFGVLYYCAAGKLYKATLPGLSGPVSSSSEVLLSSLPTSGGVTCTGSTMIYEAGDATTNPVKPPRLIFPISQNGISGVAEYTNP